MTAILVDTIGHIDVYRYDCGHEHRTMLLSPPKECPACRQERFSWETEARMLSAEFWRNRRRAAEQAEKAHDYGKRHLICRLCFVSRSVDALALTEAHASMFTEPEIKW